MGPLEWQKFLISFCMNWHLCEKMRSTITFLRSQVIFFLNAKQQRMIWNSPKSKRIYFPCQFELNSWIEESPQEVAPYYAPCLIRSHFELFVRKLVRKIWQRLFQKAGYVCNITKGQASTQAQKIKFPAPKKRKPLKLCSWIIIRVTGIAIPRPERTRLLSGTKFQF